MKTFDINEILNTLSDEEKLFIEKGKKHWSMDVFESTTSQSLYKANLPQSLMDIMDEYYEDEESYGYKPLVRLWIDVTKLDLNKLTWDDDYILNKYGWNKATTDKEKVIESLDIWGSVAYLDTIPKNIIVKYDFDYSN